MSIRNLDCYYQWASDLLEGYGVTAEVTFKRVDATSSEAAVDMYGERREVDKTYKTWTLHGVVEQDPRSNTYGRGGGEVEADIMVDLYTYMADGGTESGTAYEPQYQDLIDFRGTVYEVDKITQIAPTGTDGKLAIRIEGTKHR